MWERLIAADMSCCQDAYYAWEMLVVPNEREDRESTAVVLLSPYSHSLCRIPNKGNIEESRLNIANSNTPPARGKIKCWQLLETR